MGTQSMMKAATPSWVRARPALGVLLLVAVLAACSSEESNSAKTDEALDEALNELVAMPSGPPGVIALVQRSRSVEVHTAGVADVASGRTPEADDYMRVASVAKAFSGAVALSLVDEGTMGIDDTIGQRLPDQPAAFHAVTLRQLLNHTSGVPDFIRSPAFAEAIRASLDQPPPPAGLMEFIRDVPLAFPPGSRYQYSNSDNIMVGLMVEAVTGRPYDEVLKTQVLDRLDLEATSLPRGTEIGDPLFHGYDLAPPAPPEDVSRDLPAGWAWASGGVVSTPADLNRFIRGYVGGALFGEQVRDEQRRFVVGGESGPPGPGENSAGLALFRYETRCGTVLGHTGNTVGFTQFAAATPDGRRSVTVSMNLQRTDMSEDAGLAVYDALRRAEESAVCASLAA